MRSPFGSVGPGNGRGYPDAAFAIAGHHGGLPDPTGGEGTLTARIKKTLTEVKSLEEIATSGFPDFASIQDKPAQEAGLTAKNFDLHTRMLFSCLVDADRFDTADRELIDAPLKLQGGCRFYLSALRRLNVATALV